MRSYQLSKGKLSISWTKHLKDREEVRKFKEYVLNSVGVTNRLADILEEKVKNHEVFKEEDYKNPSWAFAQADRNGYVRALIETIELLKGIDQYDRD